MTPEVPTMRASLITDIPIPKPVALVPQHALAVRVPCSEYTYMKRHFGTPINDRLYDPYAMICRRFVGRRLRRYLAAASALIAVAHI
jgi:hypothetical protein